MNTLLIAAVISLLPASFLLIYFVSKRNERSELELIEQLKKSSQERSLKSLQKLDQEIENWLAQLELPVFEDKTKLKEASHQLSTLLIERLLLKRCPDRHQTNHQTFD